MVGSDYRHEIERIFANARKRCPKITDEQLYRNGAIFYENGNDGTAFDWEINERLCEFCIYHKNKKGFIKALVYDNNLVWVYIYEDGGMKSTQAYTDSLTGDYASDFAELMCKIADEPKKYGVSLDELNWNVDLSNLGHSEITDEKDR